MRLKNVNLIFRKELRDVLRDRRTLIATFVLPIVLYPGFIIGFAQVMTVQRGRQAEQVYQVAVRGRDRAEDLFALIGKDDRLELPRRAEADEEALLDGRIELLVIVPKHFRDAIDGDTTARIGVKYDQSRDRSRAALERFHAVVTRYREMVLERRLHGLDPPQSEAFIRPVRLDPENLAPRTQVLLSLAGGVLVFLAVTMALTGAFYPAVDACAGEKERGTIETLLVSPATRTEIVFGKYVLVLVMSLATAVLNLISMALTVFAMVRVQGSLDGTSAPLGVGQLAAALPSMVWVFFLLIPVAAFFSAMALALATFARSTKEAQYYMLPLYLVALPLAGLGVIPGIDLSYLLDLVPVAGAAVVFRSLLAGHGGVAPHAVLVFVANFAYAAVAIQWTASLFRREEVLFREAEEFDWRFWRWVSFRSTDGRPTMGQVILAFGGGLLLMWYTMPFLTGIGSPALMIMLQQLAAVAAPVLILAGAFRLNWARTFRLRLGRPATWAAWPLAVVLAAGMHVLLVEGIYLLRHELPVPPGLEKALELVLGGTGGFWVTLAVFALLPALTEEFMFRGFILSGLRSRTTAVMAVTTAALLFGVFHLNVYQFVQATIGGVLLGVIALRTGSLLPCILYHFTNNALSVLLGVLDQWPGPIRAAVVVPNGEHYRFWAVPAAAVLVVGSLTLIWRVTRQRARVADDPRHSTQEVSP